MDDRLASLTSSDARWSALLVISTVIVTAGVIALIFVELTPLPVRWSKLRQFVRASAALVLTLGIAGELLAEGKTISTGEQMAALLNEKASAANDRAARAQVEAANAAIEAAEIRERATDTEKEMERLKQENVSLQMKLLPRFIDRDDFVRKFADAPKGSVDLQYAKGDLGAYRFALQLLADLRIVQWDVTDPSPIDFDELSKSVHLIPNDIVIFFKPRTSIDEQRESMELSFGRSGLKTPYTVLSSVLWNSSNTRPASSFPDMTLPDDNLRVVIGPRP